MPKFLDVTDTDAARKALAVGDSTVNVLHYGATGDGVTDDTSAIHAARDAAGVGGKVFFPAGTYLVDGLTASVAGQTWELHPGATVKMKTGASSILTITGTGVTVTGGVFDGSNGVTDAYNVKGVWVNADGVTIDKATVRDSPLYGIMCSDHNRFRASRCTVINSKFGGIWVDNYIAGTSNVYDISIVDNVIDSSTSAVDTAAGIVLYGQSTNQRLNRAVISGNTIILPSMPASANAEPIALVYCNDFTVSGNVCIGGYTGISTAAPRRATISGNVFYGFKIMAVEIQGMSPGASYVTVADNIIDSNLTGAEAGVETSQGSVSNITISGNNFTNFTGNCNPILFTTGTSVDTVAITGNTITSTASGLFCGMNFTVASASNVAITGNVVNANSTAQSKAISFERNASGVSIVGNHFTNIAQDAVRFSPYRSGETQNNIKIIANNYTNCTTAYSGSASGGATLGPNVITDTVTTATVNSGALRDSNANLSANAFVPSLATTATAAGTTTLTVGSKEVQRFTGSTTQTCVLPTTDVVAGQRFTIINSSSGAVTVNASGGGTVGTLPGGTSGIFVANVATPTTASAWAFVNNVSTLYSPTINTPKIDAINDSNNKTVVSVVGNASAVNYLNLCNRVSGGGPIIEAAGSDSDVSLEIRAKGAGYVLTKARGQVSSMFTAVASAVNYLTVEGRESGVSPRIYATGTDTDIGINLVAKGAGTVQANSNPVGIKVAVPASASATGVVGQWAADSSYIYVCTAANTWVRSTAATW